MEFAQIFSPPNCQREDMQLTLSGYKQMTTFLEEHMMKTREDISKFSKLSDKFDDLRRNFINSNELVSKYELENTSLSHRLSLANDLIRSLKESSSRETTKDSQDTLKFIRKMSNSLNENFGSLSEIEAYFSDLPFEKLRKENEDLRTECNALKKSQSIMKESSNSSENRIKMLEGRILALEKSTSLLSSSLKESEASKEELRSLIKRSAEAKDHEVEKLKSDLCSLTADLGEKTNELSRKEAEISELRSRVESILKEKFSLESILSEFSAKSEKIIIEKRKLKEELKDWKDHARKSGHIPTYVQEEFASTQKEIQRLSRSRNYLVGAIHKAGAAIEKSEQQIERIQSEFLRLICDRLLHNFEEAESNRLKSIVFDESILPIQRADAVFSSISGLISDLRESSIPSDLIKAFKSRDNFVNSMKALAKERSDDEAKKENASPFRQSELMALISSQNVAIEHLKGKALRLKRIALAMRNALSRADQIKQLVSHEDKGTRADLTDEGKLRAELAMMKLRNFDLEKQMRKV